MRALRNCLIATIFAFAVTSIHAQNKDHNEKEKKTGESSHKGAESSHKGGESSPKSAEPSRRSAEPSQPAAPTGRGAASGRGATPNAGGGNVPNNMPAGRGGTPNAGGGNVPNNMPAGRGGSPNAGGGNMPAGRGGSPNAGGGNAPNNMPAGRGGSPNAGGGNMPAGRGGSPNAGGGNAPNNMPAGRGGSPNAGGGNVPNNMPAGRGGSPNAGGGNVPGSREGRQFGAGAPARRPDPVRGGMVRTPSGATAIHAPGGARTFVVERPGGARIVTNSRGHGYMERPVVLRGGSRIVQRTYYVGGTSYVRVYRPLTYRGIEFQVYTPTRYYAPRFYTWGYTPWSTRVVYTGGFGWIGPGYGYYGGYFAPYPYYAGPNYWLTDYLLAASLQAAYQQRLDAAASAGAPPPYNPSGQVALSPQVKDLIAAEVQRNLALANAESQNPQAAVSGPPPILDGNPHVFVVSSSLIASTDTQDCALTEGDVLQLNPAPPRDPNYANVRVLASKAQDCRAGQIIPVALADLQEMANQMRATIDQGLAEMQNRQGQGGLPPIDASLRAQTASPIAAELPPPDAGIANELRQQAQQSDLSEEQAFSGTGEAPPTIQLGQTIAQVVAILGKPNTVGSAGQKTIYSYKDMKVIFMDGKVSDIQ